MLSSSQLELADAQQVDMLAGDPKIVGVLHCEPTLGRAANRLGKAKRHFWRDPARALEDATQRRGCNIQLFSELAATDAIGLKVNIGDELTRMRGVVHSHW